MDYIYGLYVYIKKPLNWIKGTLSIPDTLASNKAFCRSVAIKSCLLSFVIFSGDRQWCEITFRWVNRAFETAGRASAPADVPLLIRAIFKSCLLVACLGRTVLFPVCWFFSSCSSPACFTISFSAAVVIVASWSICSTFDRPWRSASVCMETDEGWFGFLLLQHILDTQTHLFAALLVHTRDQKNKMTAK